MTKKSKVVRIGSALITCITAKERKNKGTGSMDRDVGRSKGSIFETGKTEAVTLFFEGNAFESVEQIAILT
jgi:hypothetical protein